MNIASHFDNLLEYEIRANQETLKILKETKSVSDEIIRIFSHMQAVRRLWLQRVRRESTNGFDAFPTWTLKEAEAAMEAMDSAWRECLEDISEPRLEETLLYEDTKGGFWSTRVYDAFVQVFHHSSHHRGQIALLLRQNGNEPIRADYILYHREREEG